jgi:hypothetical protein
MGQVVAALEHALNVHGPGSTAPGEDQRRTLEKCLATFHTAPAARLRRQVIGGGFTGCALALLLSLTARQPRVAAGFAGLGLMTAVGYFVINGVANRTELFMKVRSLILESRRDWLTGIAALALVAATLAVFHLHWAYIGFGILGVALALVLHFEVDRRVEAQRREALSTARMVIKNLRLQGVGEQTLWRFVRAMGGERWENFFEALFGAEMLPAAREPSDRGLHGLIRRRALPWRDWVSSWVEARLDARRQERETLLLRGIEERGLLAERVNLLTARRKSRRTAEAMVTVAAESRAAVRAHVSGIESGAHPPIARAIHEAAEAPENILVEREHGLIRPETSWFWNLLLGARTRFLLGATLVVGFLLWVDQNGIVQSAQIKGTAARAIEHPDPLQALRDTRIDVRVPVQTKPLHLSGLPRPIASLFRDWGAGGAGLLLILSALVPGPKMVLFAVPGAAIALFGPTAGVPRIGPMDPSMASLALGAGVTLLGLVLGASKATGFRAH